MQQVESDRAQGRVVFLDPPSDLADKIPAAQETFGFSRFVIQTANGIIVHAAVMRAIELFGTKLAPELRRTSL